MKSKTLNEGQTPEEKFLAIGKLTQRIEQSFIELGELLTGIKRAKLYRLKGFESFKNFVEAEYSFSSGLANKLVRLYEIFVEGMDQDAETLNGIGFDRLMTIAPVVEKADWEKREELMEMAADQPLPELFESLKKMKEEAQVVKPQDLKKVLVEQWKEQMCNLFNCSWSEAQFKLALWFSSGDRSDAAVLTLMKQEVRGAQAKFEREVSNADR